MNPIEKLARAFYGDGPKKAVEAWYLKRKKEQAAKRVEWAKNNKKAHSQGQ